MTVSSSTNSINQLSDGLTDTFTYDFLALDQDHLYAYHESDLDTPLVIISSTGIGNQSGGTITLSENPPSGVITIIRFVPMTQEQNYVDYNKFPAETLEKGLDLALMRAQQIYDYYIKSIRVPVNEPDGVYNITLPSADDRKSKFIAFDADGNLIASNAINSPVSDFMLTLLDDLDAASGRNTLGITELLALKANITSSTGSAILPSGTTAERDASPVAKYIRYNSDLNKYEGYFAAPIDAWAELGGGQLLGNSSVKPIFYNSQNISEDITIPGTTNAMTAGPITIDDGFTVTVEDGATWSIV